MAIHYSDQVANTRPDNMGKTRRNSTSEAYGRVRSFNVTLNAAGNTPNGASPAAKTYANGDVIVLTAIKTNDKVRSIKLLNAAAASGVTLNIGLAAGDISPKMPISGTNNGAYGTILDATAFASGDNAIATARVQPYELAFENRAPAEANNFAWQDAGLSENPGGTLLVVAQVASGTWTLAADQVAFLIDVIND